MNSATQAVSVGSILVLHWPWDWVVGRAFFGIMIVPLFTACVHSLRAYFLSIDVLDEQLRHFSVDHCSSSCCEEGHPDKRLCDRKVPLIDLFRV